MRCWVSAGRFRRCALWTPISMGCIDELLSTLQLPPPPACTPLVSWDEATMASRGCSMGAVHALKPMLVCWL